MLTGDMLRRATARFPDKTAIIWEGRHMTYTDLNAQANRFAHALKFTFVLATENFS